MKLSSTKFLFITLFVLALCTIFYLNTINKNALIQKELQQAIKDLQINYDITTSMYKTDSLAVHISLKHNKKLLNILSEALDANTSQRAILRKKMLKMFHYRYISMQEKGILQFQFVFPDNISFVRLHKPSKFGDDLSKVRYSFVYTNKTHKPSFGFEQGRTSHAFRTVYPLFKGKKYLGCYEVSYTSEHMQKNLTNINKIHSHFLVNKVIFDANAWKRKKMVLEYKKSIENDNYMYALADNTNHKNLATAKRILIDPHKKMIAQKMSKSEKFAYYEEMDSHIKIIAFLPIRNIKNTITAAYIVSYTDSPHIKSILHTYKVINIVSFILLTLILYLIYKQVKSKKEMELKTIEQTQLLSLIDKGDITLFKWRNDKAWSVEHVSDNVKALTGYSQEEFYTNKIDYMSIVHKDDLDIIKDEIAFAIDNKKQFFTHRVYRIVTKDKQIKWLRDSTNVITDGSGEVTHFLGYIIDITTMKLLELEIQELNKNLHIEVQKQTNENLKKDKLLQEQSKLAAMGEMVGSIAHQWRQPLNSLNINIQNLDDDYFEGLINEDFIENFIEKQTQTIQFMSQTIDDFRNFFRVDKTQKLFSVKEAIKFTLSIQGAQLANYNISTVLDGDDFELKSTESEFLQVILNLITNAKDAIIEKNIKDGKINIVIDAQKKSIMIKDNAGGIPVNIKDRIFEPYFTTKEQGKGTGMGLYMSKVIIEQNMGGTLMVKNDNDGAVFIISF